MHQLGTLPSRKMLLLLQQWTLIMAIMAVSLGSAAAQEPGRAITLYGFRAFPDAGGLMSYGPSDVFFFRRFAAFVDKILKGVKPAELPVEQSTKFERRVGEDVATLTPHSAGRAELPHPVLHGRASLTAV